MTTDDGLKWYEIQDWKGLMGSQVFHLIERHAEGWDEINEAMTAWLNANRQPVDDSSRSDAANVHDSGGVYRELTFDSYTVLQNLSGKAKQRTSAENVSDVLDALHKAAILAGKGSENG